MKPTNEKLADLMRHAAQTLRGCGLKTTSRGVENVQRLDGKWVERVSVSAPLVSELVLELEDAALELERS